MQQADFDHFSLGGAAAAFARYQAIRPRLPAAQFPAQPVMAPDLSAVADRWDGFVLDAYGVLNVGEEAISGAVARMVALRAMGRRLCVLTNAASYTRPQLIAKYHRLGYDFTPDEVVSSRDLAADHLQQIAPDARWAAIAAQGDDFHDLPARVIDALDHPAAFDDADGVLFLSSARWTAPLQARLVAALARRPRPFVIANPDLVAPVAGAFSLEPGLFAHAAIDLTGGAAHWFGKPYGHGFAAAAARTGLAPAQLAMVGDTLHTDILGGAAAGMGTVLVAGHGLFAGHDPAPFIAASGIVPDVICATT